jgi:hypothetical protein
MVTTGCRSADLSALCASEAVRLGYDASFAPSRKSVDDLRAGRFYPSLVVTLLIASATSEEIGLRQWADDVVRLGSRRREERA